jgi:hypothetical protein
VKNPSNEKPGVIKVYNVYYKVENLSHVSRAGFPIRLVGPVSGPQARDKAYLNSLSQLLSKRGSAIGQLRGLITQ